MQLTLEEEVRKGNKLDDQLLAYEHSTTHGHTLTAQDIQASNDKAKALNELMKGAQKKASARNAMFQL